MLLPRHVTPSSISFQTAASEGSFTHASPYVRTLHLAWLGHKWTGIRRSPRLPAYVHLWSDFVTTVHASLPLEGQRSLLSVMLKALNLQHSFILFLHSSHILQCLSRCFCFTHWCTGIKTTTTYYPDDAFSCYVLIWDASGCISVYATKTTRLNGSQTIPASGLSEYAFSMHLGGHLHLYIVLSTWDLITWDAFWNKAQTGT